MSWDPDSISQSKLHDLRRAAEHAWSDETRSEDSRGHPQASAGQCFVTSAWLANKIGGHVGTKDGHFFTVTPDKNYVIDLTGDQTASAPAIAQNVSLDEEDEPFEFDPEQLRHRPGPVVYTQATNPLYKDFRIQNLPDHPRAALFANRANAALEGNLTKEADSGGSGSDAYPGEGPQAEEEFNLRNFHDPVIDDLNLSMEEPVEHDYKFVFANGGFQVSPVGDHETMADEAGIAPDHTGPMAFGHINVRGRDALWSVESNIGLRGLVKRMQGYCKQRRWEWGGLVDGSGQPVSEEFAGKKSYWYGWREGKLLFSERPFWPHRGRIDVINKVAHFEQVPNPFVRPALEEWAEDFGFRFASYPGGTDMNDRVKNKEWPTTYDKGDPEADPGKVFDGEPQGELTCPYCDETLPNFKAYVMHTQDHQDPKAQPIDDGHFPTIRPLDEPLGFGTQSQPTAIPVMGAIQQDSWYFAPANGATIDGWMIKSTGTRPALSGWSGRIAESSISGKRKPSKRSTIFSTDMRLSMAIDPTWLTSYMRTDPYLYHITSARHLPSIRQQGLLPDQAPTIEWPTIANPRPGHVYLGTLAYAAKPPYRPEPLALRTHIQNLDSNLLNPDEDTIAGEYERGLPHWRPGQESWGEWANRVNAVAPEMTQHSVESGRAAYNGQIPPEHLEVHNGEDWEPLISQQRLTWHFEAAGGKEGKDLLQASVPFLYDVEKDYLVMGHPGMNPHDIQGQFTPGGIVEGTYEPGGKMVIRTTTTIPFSTFHLMQLFYHSHPGLEITSLEIENEAGETHKVA